MNRELETPDDADDQLESVLKSLQPADDSAQGPSNGQLMYAMGYAAGMAAAKEDSVSLPVVSATSNHWWQLATVAATVVAATLAFQLYSTVSDVESGDVALNHVEASEDVAIEKVIAIAELEKSASRVKNDQPLPAASFATASFVRSIFVGRSKDSAFMRRGQILGAAESVNLDEALEQFVSIASLQKPTQRRNGDAAHGFSPRSTVEELLTNNEFLGL